MVLMAVPEILQVVPYVKTLINGVILLLFIIFLPNGIVGWFSTGPARHLKSRKVTHGPA
jgi:ABC-type branched-subunit amino acid transport system permease subunit